MQLNLVTETWPKPLVTVAISLTLHLPFVTFTILVSIVSYIFPIICTQCHSLGSLAVLRGVATENDLGILSDVERRMKKDLNTVSWNPFPLDFWTGICYILVLSIKISHTVGLYLWFY